MPQLRHPTQVKINVTGPIRQYLEERVSLQPHCLPLQKIVSIYHKEIFRVVINKLRSKQFPEGTIYEPRTGQFREKELDVLYAYEFSGIKKTCELIDLEKPIKENIIEGVEKMLINETFWSSPFSPFPDSLVYFFSPYTFKEVLRNAVEWGQVETCVSDFNAIEKHETLQKISLNSLFEDYKEWLPVELSHLAQDKEKQNFFL